MLFILNSLIATILGAYVGRFLAMVVHYLPNILLSEEDIEEEPADIIKWFFQKPFCWHCKHSLTPLQNTPIIGYFLQNRKCPHCKSSLGIQVPLCEIGTALLFGVTMLFFPLSLKILFVLVLCCLLICCFITDTEHRILPDQFTMAIVWIGLIGSLVPVFIPPREAIIGAVGGYGIFFLFNVIYRYYRGFEGMYPGDFKLNAGIGACLGLNWLFYILFVALLLMITGTVIRVLWAKKSPNLSILHHEIPYGSYTSIVAGVALYTLII